MEFVVNWEGNDWKRKLKETTNSRCFYGSAERGTVQERQEIYIPRTHSNALITNK